jgi:hypothetical protein
MDMIRPLFKTERNSGAVRLRLKTRSTHWVAPILCVMLVGDSPRRKLTVLPVWFSRASYLYSLHSRWVIPWSMNDTSKRPAWFLLTQHFVMTDVCVAI